MHDWHVGSCCHLTRPLQLFRLLEHFEQDCYLCTQRCCCTIYCFPCSCYFKHLLELQVLPVNYTPAEMTLHATLIVGLSEMLSSLLRSSSSALLVWYPFAPGCSLCSTPDCCFGCQPHPILLPLNPAGLPLQAHCPCWYPPVHFARCWSRWSTPQWLCLLRAPQSMWRGLLNPWGIPLSWLHQGNCCASLSLQWMHLVEEVKHLSITSFLLVSSW